MSTIYGANSLIEDLFVNLIVLVFAGVGLSMYWPALNAVRVLLFCNFWPRIDAQVTGKVKQETQRLYLNSMAEFRPGPASEWRPHVGGGGTEVRSYFNPFLKLSYHWQGKAYQADNQKFWNHHSNYTREEAQAVASETPKKNLTIRLNPNRPQDIYLGAQHFPWITAPLFFLTGGLLSTGAIGAFLNAKTDLLLLQLPLIANRSPWLFFVPVLSVAYLFNEALWLVMAKMKLPSRQ